MQQVNFIKYDNSGKIIGIGSCPDTMLENQAFASTQVMLIDADVQEVLPVISTYYVNNGVLVERPLSPITKEGMVFSNIPTGIQVSMKIENSSYEITSDTVELDINFTGTYIVKFEHFPYLDAEFTVTA